MGLFNFFRNKIIDNFSSHRPYYSREGYKQVYRPNSPSARKGGYRNGYAPEHRYIYEERYGQIPQGKVIHHQNGEKWDNRSSNLEMMNKNEHDAHHGFKKYGYPKKGNRRR